MGKQNWRKLGLLLAPDGQLSWARTHVAVPVAVPLDSQRYRVFVTGRDSEGRSNIGHFELNFTSDPPSAGPLSDLPALSPGQLGCFDDRGAMSSWVVTHQGRQLHYYTGCNLGVTVPFYFSIGLAVSDDGGKTLKRFSQGPILGRSSVDPILTASACVLLENEIWRMWYVSAAKWVSATPRAKHYYHIRYAESQDGISWRPTGKICVDFRDAKEYAISRPCVLHENGLYRMWFSHRGASYRIGYAESSDGLEWERHDDYVGLDVSASGWDSEMIEYPFVFRRGQRLYMLYNGNGYGATGVGLAVLDES